MNGDEVFYKLGVLFIFLMVCEDVNYCYFDCIFSKIVFYFKDLLWKFEVSDVVVEVVYKFYVEEDVCKYGVLEKEDDGEIEIVNVDFFLVYGGMFLLLYMNFRFLKGYCYGLCGCNGVGKLILMKSIVNGKFEGFLF